MKKRSFRDVPKFTSKIDYLYALRQTYREKREKMTPILPASLRNIRFSSQ